jgi:ATP-dependent DNA helicase Rep
MLSAASIRSSVKLLKYLDGPLLVLAGAGSGKTRVITRKIAYLVTECGIDARHIAAITFTNKAAREMRERVAELLPGRLGKGLTVSTFHSLGLQILRPRRSASATSRASRCWMLPTRSRYCPTS